MNVSSNRTQAQGTTPRETVRVQLEIRWGEETIRGRLTVEGEQPSDFYGWLELINLLERDANRFGRCRVMPSDTESGR